MITMNDIIRDGHPTLREVAKEITFPLNDELKKLASDMIEFLKNSQDVDTAKKYDLRPGVGIAAPQLNVSKKMLAVHIPPELEGADPFSLVMINPRILSHSVQRTALQDGEGCLSIDEVYEGFVPRNKRITVEYYDLDGNKLKKRFKDYPAIVIQHEIDHLNGILFYDHINTQDPFMMPDDMDIFEDDMWYFNVLERKTPLVSWEI